MTIKYNSREYAFPSSLSSTTLKQWIKWKEVYGNELEASEKEIDNMPEGSDKDVEAFLHLSESACKTLSFYTGINLEIGKENVDIKQLMNLFNAHQTLLHQQEMELKLESEYLFQNEIWVIVPPEELVNGDGILYETFQKMKQMFIDLKSFSDGDWSKLPSLCTYYFRKEKETLEEVLLNRESRKLLMMELPMNIALTIAGYLNETLELFVTMKKL